MDKRLLRKIIKEEIAKIKLHEAFKSTRLRKLNDIINNTYSSDMGRISNKMYSSDKEKSNLLWNALSKLGVAASELTDADVRFEEPSNKVIQNTKTANELAFFVNEKENELVAVFKNGEFLNVSRWGWRYKYGGDEEDPKFMRSRGGRNPIDRIQTDRMAGNNLGTSAYMGSNRRGTMNRREVLAASDIVYVVKTVPSKETQDKVRGRQDNEVMNANEFRRQLNDRLKAYKAEKRNSKGLPQELQTAEKELIKYQPKILNITQLAMKNPRTYRHSIIGKAKYWDKGRRSRKTSLPNLYIEAWKELQYALEDYNKGENWKSSYQRYTQYIDDIETTVNDLEQKMR